jgi:hypothetical protein
VSDAELDALDRAVHRALSTLEQLKRTNESLQAELAQLKRELAARPESSAPPSPGGAPEAPVESAAPAPGGDVQPQLALLRREREEIRSRVSRLLQQIDQL